MRITKYLRPGTILLLLLAAALLAALMVSAGGASVVAAIPLNDNFADAVVITEPLPFIDGRTTSGATTETGEPSPCSDILSTVWYQFTPSSDVDLVANTAGSDYDTVLAVYTGSTVGTLTGVACNDDISFPDNLQSEVAFTATVGVAYHFQIGGFSGETGNLVFNLASTVSDSDGDGVHDADEGPCGADPFDSNSIPERVDGAFAGVDDDGDTLIDEPLPPGVEAFDCDGDGYKGTVENHVYAPSTQGDQDPCGSNAFPPTDPPSPTGWPADLVGGAFSANKVNVQDMGSFFGPVRYMGTDVGTNPGDVRWDLVPGKGFLATDINIQDLGALLAGTAAAPPMLGGVRAFNGPDCPWPP